MLRPFYDEAEDFCKPGDAPQPEMGAAVAWHGPNVLSTCF